MVRITIVSETHGPEEVSYRAMGHRRDAVGSTAGAALDALIAQLDPADAGTLVVVQKAAADQYFTTAQQKRLVELMDEKREAESRGGALPAERRAELELLVDAELESATRRSEAISREFRP